MWIFPVAQDQQTMDIVAQIQGENKITNHLQVMIGFRTHLQSLLKPTSSCWENHDFLMHFKVKLIKTQVNGFACLFSEATDASSEY